MIRFQYGEVLELESNFTYRYTDNENRVIDSLYAIKVRVYGDLYKHNEFYAIPLDINTKKIPLIGEHVLLIAGPDKFSQLESEGGLSTIWYYVSTFSIKSSLSHNMLPGISGRLSQDDIDNTLPGKTFDKNTATSPLQPFEGDIITEGRHGNSIRLGSTSKQDESRYSIQPTWSGNSVNDPIIILSNTSTRPDSQSADKKQFIVENIQTNDSSLYLTSTQKLSGLVLNNKLTIGTSESDFASSQFVGVADRVILKSKTDIIALDAFEGIELNAEQIHIGVSDKKEPMLHSGAVKEILKELINMVSIGFADSSGAASTAIYKAKFDTLLRKIDNDNILIDKHPLDF